ncbi:S-layer homology domain-containing protein [Paenibacillus sp. 1P07SE]|uniref:S-layer homology domain-containing protein n=1 Tax=Paenibacillus sp. 1P07SE TaxID=3132209 RepID=UPI0039A67A14
MFPDRRGAVRIDTVTGVISSIGAPEALAGSVQLSADGHTGVYLAGDGEDSGGSQLYLSCTGGCSEPQPGGPVTGAQWSAGPEAIVGGHIKPGSVLNIRASAQPDLELVAEVAYLEADPERPDQTVGRQTTLPLEESGMTGMYAGAFAVTEGMSEVTAIRVAVAGSAEGLDVPRMPLPVAGRLEVEVEAVDPARMEGAYLLLTGDGMPEVVADWQNGISRYELYGAPGTALTLELMYRDGTSVLARYEGLVLAAGQRTEQKVVPEFNGTLRVNVYSSETYDPIPDARVVFKDADSGEVLADLTVDEEGFAALPVPRREGTRIEVEASAAGYDIPEPQTITLAFGANMLAFDLRPMSGAIRSVTMTFEREVSRAPVIGSEARILVSAVPGAELEARVNLTRWEEEETQPDQLLFTLVETQPGQYEAAFPVVEGMASLDSVVLRLGGEWLPVSYPVDRNIAARLHVRLAVPTDDAWRGALSGGRLGVSYSDPDSGVHYSDTAAFPEGQYETVVDVPFAHADHRYQLFFSGNGASGTVEAAAPRAGRVQDIQLHPRFAVTLNARVLNEEGAAVRASYTIRDEEGRSIAEGGAASAVTQKMQVDAGQVLKLHWTPEDPDYDNQEFELSVAAPILIETYRLDRKPTGILSGVVQTSGGRPSTGARIAVTVTEGKASKLYTTVSGRDGRYSLTLPAGYTVDARAEGSGTDAALTSANQRLLIEDESTLDFTLYEGATLDFKLYVRNAHGEWQGPADVDWFELDRYGVTFSRPIVRMGSPIQLAAVVGETIQACVGEHRVQVRDCTEVTIGADNHAELEMRYENRWSEAAFRPVRPDGTTVPWVHTQIIGIAGEAAAAPPTYNYGDGSGIQLHRPGTYRILVSEGGQVRSQALAAQAEFTVAAAQQLDLGTLRLHPAGKFSGADNRIFAASDNVAPNGLMELHAVYANNGIPRETAVDAELIFDLPLQAAYVDHSAVVDRQAVDARTEGRQVIVPLGSVAPAQQGTARIQIKVEPEPMLQGMTTHASIRYSLGTEVRKEGLGTAYVEMHPVTLRAPEKTTRLQLYVSGHAPPGEQVAVYENSELLGRAQVSPNGTWLMAVTLADNGMTNRRLRTETTLDGASYGGQSAIVRYVPNDIVIQDMSFQLYPNPIRTFSPAEGVAVFPYNAHNGLIPSYTMQFSDPDRVYNVRVGNGERIDDARREGGKYVLQTKKPAFSGPISVAYETRSDPEELEEEAPTPEQGRNLNSDALANAELMWLAQAGEWSPRRGGIVPDNTEEMRLKLTDDVAADIVVSRTPAPDYVPTSQDLRLEALTGRSLYGVTVSHSPWGSKAEVTVTAYVPDGVGISGMRKSGASPASAGMSKLTVHTVLDGLRLSTKLFDNWQSIEAVVKPTDVDKVDGLIRDIHALECIEDFARARLLSNANAARFTAIQHETAKQMMNLIGSMRELSPGASLILWGEIKWAGKELDRIMLEDIRDLENNIKAYVCMKKPTEPQRVAEPKYIYDPSGYVYEGLPGNRVEGVTATIYNLEEASGRWELWDAEWYEQINPQLTNAEGRYGWDVPPGWWQVKYEKKGYERAYSEELEVLPPHFDVNIPLVSYAPPEVTAVKPLPGGSQVEVRFSKAMTVAAMTREAVVIEGPGGIVRGQVQAVEPGEGADGELLANGLRFLPDSPLAGETDYTITVGDPLRSYAGVPLAEAYTGSFTVVSEDLVPPAPVTEVIGAIGRDQAVLGWQAPADLDEDGVLIRWRQRGEASFGEVIRIGQGTQWHEIGGLVAGRAYEFGITAVDESGNRSAEVRVMLEEDAAREDLRAPHAPGELSVTPQGGSRLGVSWRDPADEDLAGLELSWQVEDAAGQPSIVGIEPGVESYTIAGLSASTRYRIGVVGVDEAGNRSSVVTVTVSTGSGGGSGGSGDPGGSGGGTGGSAGPVKPDPGGEPGGEDPPGDPDDVFAGYWEIGRAGGVFTAKRGRLQVSVPAGAFTEGGRLQWQEDKGEELPEPGSGYTRLSPVYTLQAEGWQSRRAITIRLAYDAVRLAGRDPMRIGIYRVDAGHPSGWRYVGGVADLELNEVQTLIEGPGEYAVLLYDITFADMQGHWAREAAEVLASRHLAEGAGERRYEPGRPITRAEAAKLLVEMVRVYGVPSQDVAAARERFQDVGPDRWYSGYVDEAVRLGLMQGAAGRFRPQDAITREELATVLARAASRYGIEVSSGGGFEGFADAASISGWARESMALAVRRGWLIGRQQSGGKQLGLFPRDSITRAETAMLLVRVMSELDEKAREK